MVVLSAAGGARDAGGRHPCSPAHRIFLPLGIALIEGFHGEDKGEEAARIRTALLALGAGTLATVGAIYTARTFELNRRGQITERFTRAIEQLGKPDSVDVRVGGIYALERIAFDSPDEHGPIMDVLTAYVREHAPPPPPRSAPKPEPPRPLW